MNIKPQSQQSISDDQELAKVLAGVNQQADSSLAATDLQFEDAAAQPAGDAPDVTVPVPPAPQDTPAVEIPAPSFPAADASLDSIKQSALNELRPLVDKLNVSPEEKFDTYLLLLRSTDDRDLIAPAHEAARNIADEARRAQALLDIIKEIDYLSAPQQPAAS